MTRCSATVQIGSHRYRCKLDDEKHKSPLQSNTHVADVGYRIAGIAQETPGEFRWHAHMAAEDLTQHPGLTMDSQPQPAATIQDRIKAALLSAGRDMVYEENILGADPDTAQSWVSGIGIPAPLGGSIHIEWERNAQGNLLSPHDHPGLEFEVRLRSTPVGPARPGWPPSVRRNLLMALCASPEYAAAVARQICAEQNVEALRHGHDEFKRAGLYCPTCIKLGLQTLPPQPQHIPEEEDG